MPFHEHRFLTFAMHFSSLRVKSIGKVTVQARTDHKGPEGE
jgi:hypothetical protein